MRKDYGLSAIVPLDRDRREPLRQTIDIGTSNQIFNEVEEENQAWRISRLSETMCVHHVRSGDYHCRRSRFSAARPMLP